MDTYGFAAAGEAASDDACPEDHHDGMPAIEELKSLGKRWVYWKNQSRTMRNGVVKLAKVPFTPDGWSGRIEHLFPDRQITARRIYPTLEQAKLAAFDAIVWLERRQQGVTK
jgi:hypothetical protein